LSTALSPFFFTRFDCQNGKKPGGERSLVPAVSPAREALPAQATFPGKSTISQQMAFTAGMALTAIIAIFWREKGTL